ncbi:MAG: hypothetical protein E6J85_15020 [Deltaproteobacteria bacterium]|nr:MAG: hypothetical protein E6J85_15020 [Deltaproteobacteria bacterium]
MSRRLPFAAAVVVFVALFATAAPVGFVRDEGYYFEAAKSCEAWLVLLLHDPFAAIRATEQYWSYNFEHPGLAKLLFASSHLAFTSTLHFLPDAQSWRLPGFFFAALLAFWLAVLGGQRSRACALLAPALFFCTERTFFHAHLAAFDVPICALTAGVGVAWARAIGILPGSPSRMSGGPWLAFVYGCALAVKHNAWLLPPVLVVHALFLPAAARRRAFSTLPWLLLSPLILFAAWPLLWHDPVKHLGDWIAFHTHHVHYAWYYFGRELRAPPFPVVYPLAVLAVALPLPQVVLGAAAGLRLLWDLLRRNLGALRLLELGLAGGAVLPFLLGTTPIFGGIKHWLAFVALLMPEAAALLEETVRTATGAVPWHTRTRALAAGALAALLPGLWQIAHLHPYGTSAYGELAGDLPGAASLGMQRQYWSNNVTSVLPWLNAHAPRGARVFFHEVNVESYRAYLQSGALRADIRYASGPWDAEYAALQWHREFRDREPETWNAFGTKMPATGLYLDEVPQVVVYARPGLPGAP